MNDIKVQYRMCRMTVFEDCQATTLTSRPPWPVPIDTQYGNHFLYDLQIQGLGVTNRYNIKVKGASVVHAQLVEQLTQD